MRKLILLASAAAMAVASPLIAQGRGGGQGGGHGSGQGQAEARGGGQGKGQAQRGPERREQRVLRVEQGGGHGRGHGNRDVRRAERGQDRGNRGIERDVRSVEQGRGPEILDNRRGGRRDWADWLDRRGPGADGRGRDRFSFFREGRPLPVRVARDGCPPGLAKQNAFCLPPGQLRRAELIGQRIDRSRFGPVPQDWLYRFRDDGDFYYLADPDGFVYRVDRDNDLVTAIIPLMASGLGIGQPLPLGYEVYNVPFAYRDDFVDNDEWLYRYDDNAIYRVNGESGLIDSVVALLTGNPISVGSQLPPGYDVYNLPYGYRDRYADGQDSLYRYANGGIYQVDPTTMLVQALVEMIA